MDWSPASPWRPPDWRWRLALKRPTLPPPAGRLVDDWVCRADIFIRDVTGCLEDGWFLPAGPRPIEEAHRFFTTAPAMDRAHLAAFQRKFATRAFIASLILATAQDVRELLELQALRGQLRLALTRPPESSFALTFADGWIARCLREAGERMDVERSADPSCPTTGPLLAPSPASMDTDPPSIAEPAVRSAAVPAA
jgi:hypothetical protein